MNVVTAIAFPLSVLPAFYIAFTGGGYWAWPAKIWRIPSCCLLACGSPRVVPCAPFWHTRWTFSPLLARQFLHFGVFVGLATIFATIVYQFDNFLVGTFVGVDTLGYYDRAYRIAEWSSILVGSVRPGTVFYAYSRLQNDIVRLTKTA